MTPVKSVLMGISAGVIVYFLAPHIGGVAVRDNESMGGAIIAEQVTPTVSPSAKQVTRGATSGDTKMSPGATMVTLAVSPSVSVVPSVTPSVTPRLATPAPLQSNTPAPTPSPSRPPVTPAPSPTPSPTSSPTPSPLPSATPTPSPTSPPVVAIVINEVAWAGTSANASDEWFELYNPSSATVALDGWKLVDGQGKTIISLSGSIAAGDYYLVERTDDAAVSDITANVFGPFGGSGFVNAGRDIALQNESGVVVDSVSCGTGWFAGDLATKATMERVQASVSGNDAANWKTNTGAVTSGTDAAGSPILGTPAYRNSVAEA